MGLRQGRGKSSEDRARDSILLSAIPFFPADDRCANGRAADKQQGDPQNKIACVAGLRRLDGVILCGAAAVAGAAGIAGTAAARKLCDLGVFAALESANRAFLMLQAGFRFGGFSVDLPNEGVRRKVHLVATFALVPVIVSVRFPTIAVGVLVRV